MSLSATSAGSETAPGLPRWIEAPTAVLLLVALSPILALAALAVVLTTGSPVLYRQTRVGRHGREFTLIKLRSMTTDTTGPTVTSSRDRRVTRVGKLLRRLKIDELPELVHVIGGQMAFVGPRPEVPSFVEPDDPLWLEVLAVRPGLTDPVTLRLLDEESLLAEAARSGADVESFYRERLLPHKLGGYVAYLERRSWRTDLGVLWATALAVLGRRQGPEQPVTLDEID